MINDLSERYQKAKNQYERPATKVFVLQYAKPSYLRRSPSFILNITIALVCALLFLTGYLLLKGNIKAALRD
jgi:uncharacterized protein involved in exopolysaccharide biosynthesis